MTHNKNRKERATKTLHVPRFIRAAIDQNTGPVNPMLGIVICSVLKYWGLIDIGMGHILDLKEGLLIVYRVTFKCRQ